MADINFPNYFEILFSKIKDFFLGLTEMEIAIVATILFFVAILLICLLVIVVECLVRCRTRRNNEKVDKLSAETYFKRSLKVSERMSKINTPEFKHFEIELRRDSGRGSITSSRESGLDSCFIDRCNHNRDKHEIDEATGGVIV